MSIPKTLLPYFFFGLLNLVAGITEMEVLKTISKPLLIPTLAYFFYKEAPQTTLNRYVMAALVFSWLGDVLLMFVKSAEIFFALGLGSFLLAHLVYIVINMSAVNQPGSGLKPQWQDIPFVIYGFLIFGLLKDQLNGMYFPVLAYAVVICIMALTARKRWKRVGNESFWLVMIGVLTFMLSDSLIAINRFLEPLPQANLLIMSSYIMAQYLIIQGLIAFLQKIPQGESH